MNSYFGSRRVFLVLRPSLLLLLLLLFLIPPATAVLRYALENTSISTLTLTVSDSQARRSFAQLAASSSRFPLPLGASLKRSSPLPLTQTFAKKLVLGLTFSCSQSFLYCRIFSPLIPRMPKANVSTERRRWRRCQNDDCQPVWEPTRPCTPCTQDGLGHRVYVESIVFKISLSALSSRRSLRRFPSPRLGWAIPRCAFNFSSSSSFWKDATWLAEPAKCPLNHLPAWHTLRR